MVDGAADDEAEMMARFVRTRDRRLFEALFVRYRRAMVAYAGRYVRQPSRAEELAQEVFVRVFTTKRYEPDASFKSWLYRVATNVCLNEVRRPGSKEKTVSIDDAGAPEPPASDAHAPDATLAGKQLEAGLTRRLSALPDKQRAAFIMARLDGLSHDEIALALETSVPAVKSLIHRALEALREEAARYAEGRGPAEVRG